MTAAVGQVGFGLGSGVTGAVTTSVTGSSFYGIVWCNNGSAPTVSLTDSKGNTPYTRIGTQLVNSGGGLYIDRFICINGVGGSGHTLTAGGVGATDYNVVALVELTGCNLTSPLDQSNSNNTGASQVGTPYSSGSVSLTPPLSGE